MSNRVGMWGFACILAGSVAAVSAANACGQGPWAYGAYPYAYYAYVPNVPIWGGESIPYYAVHPPVYYSHIVPRPYGYSPYAYVPGIVFPEFEAFGLGARCPAPGLGQPQPSAGGVEGSPPGPPARSARQAVRTSEAVRPLVVENWHFQGDRSGVLARPARVHAPQLLANPYVSAPPLAAASAQRAN